MKPVKTITLSGAEVYPIIEGGKGVGVSNGRTAGAFAAAGAVGTFSGVYPNLCNEDPEERSAIQKTMTRQERSQRLITQGIEEGVKQAEIAYEESHGKGRIHMNMLWGLSGAEKMLDGILAATKGMIHGITCGAGMPYKLAELAQRHHVYFYPIISSMRAFSILWNRSYNQLSQFLGGVVYEDPWRAGGHNGISNKENPEIPEDPYPRVAALRGFMNKVGLNEVPIVMAGGVWDLAEFEDWIDNPEVSPVAFQLGTRPLLTQESPISPEWKKKLCTLEKEDIILNKFSPTNFYSSAVKNDFLKELFDRSSRQIEFRRAPEGDFVILWNGGTGRQNVYVRAEDRSRAEGWMNEGFDTMVETPDSTMVFLMKEKSRKIQKDQSECSGCLAACRFSSWLDSEEHKFTTGVRPDPRSYCILKTLQKVIQGIDIERELMFAGSNAYRFALDPMYTDGFVPTIQQLVDHLTGKRVEKKPCVKRKPLPLKS